MLMQGQQCCANTEVRQQFLAVAGIFRRNQRHITQHLQRPWREVLQVTDRCRDHVQHTVAIIWRIHDRAS
jgi:hypothetical protein